MSLRRVLAVAGVVCALTGGVAMAQAPTAREVLEQSAAAMGGLTRLQALSNLVMTGFGEYLNQQGGSAPSPDPRAPYKWTVAHDAERIFDLRNERAMTRDRRGSLFPFAIEQPWDRTSRPQTGVAALDHPVPALLEALDAETRLGPVSVEDGLTVVQFTIAQGATLWLAIDPVTKLPAWLRSIGPSTTLGDLTTHDLFHRLPAVRRSAVARRPHGRDGLARPDVDGLPRRFVSRRRCGPARVSRRRPRPRLQPRRAAPSRRRSPTRSGTCASAATAAPSSSSPITS